MILLDSQTALWVLDGSPRLGEVARDSIESSDEVYVSVATVWELTIKAMLGKLSIPERFSELVDEEGLRLLDVEAEHAEGIRLFPELLKHDPFDRLIVAQAHLEQLWLYTSDRVLLGLGRDFIFDSTL